MSVKVVEGYVNHYWDALSAMQYTECVWPSQEIDDSYYQMFPAVYTKPFKDCRKIRITVEDIED
jgi:hypothetical protein